MFRKIIGSKNNIEIILKNIIENIRMIERYKQDLYELDNNLRSRFYECSNINDFRRIIIKDYYLNDLFVKGINKDEYKDFINTKKKDKLSRELSEQIDKFNSYVPSINKYYSKINQYERTLKSVREFLAKEEVKNKSNENDSRYIIKFGFDKDKKLLCMIYKLTNNVLLMRINCEVLQVFWGEEYGARNKIVVHFYVRNNSLEISTIETYSNELRKGRGRFAIDCIEKVIVPSINEKREENNNEEIGYIRKKIRWIYGTMGELGKINSIERRQFYISCGYKFKDCSNMFYKNINI